MKRTLPRFYVRQLDNLWEIRDRVKNCRVYEYGKDKPVLFRNRGDAMDTAWRMNSRKEND